MVCWNSKRCVVGGSRRGTEQGAMEYASLNVANILVIVKRIDYEMRGAM